MAATGNGVEFVEGGLQKNEIGYHGWERVKKGPQREKMMIVKSAAQYVP